MSPPERLPFTALYVQWLDAFRALIPGAAKPGASEALGHAQEQVAANQEWEDEGGSVKPEKDHPDRPAIAAVPKIPF